jgi:hypothetical protein
MGMNSKHLPDKSSRDEASFRASRRSFLAGSRLLLGAGAAVGLGLISRNAHAITRPGIGGFGGSPKCFLQGTRIETDAGPVEVENLSIGDLVITASGLAKPIKWIGSRTFSRASNLDAVPIKISRGAVDGIAPSRDLYVSPAHAIFIDGVLIPAERLVNGITIVANGKPELETIIYYHVELENHEVLLAEGLAVESLFRDGTVAFDNEPRNTALPSGKPMQPYAPFARRGRKHELASHLRSVIAPVYDIRKPEDRVRDRLADFAELARAA